MNASQNSWKFFTIPNILTIFRILLIGPIVYLVLQEDNTCFIIGLVLIFVAIATDFFDGKIARKLNQTSEYGKILDPLADKIAVGALLVVLVINRGLPVWVAVFIIGRDFLILLAGLIWTTKHKYVVASNFLGKVAVFSIALMIVAYIVELSTIAIIFTWLAVFFAFISGIVYLKRFILTIRQQN